MEPIRQNDEVERTDKLFANEHGMEAEMIE